MIALPLKMFALVSRKGLMASTVFVSFYAVLTPVIGQDFPARKTTQDTVQRPLGGAYQVPVAPIYSAPTPVAGASQGTNSSSVEAPTRGALVPLPEPPVVREPLPILAGVDVLRKRGFDLLRGKRVGLVTNQTGQAFDGEATIDVLRSAPGVKLIALYGPEHGVRGQAWAGAKVKNTRDRKTGLPVYSLYGATRMPTAAMLKGVQTLVFDLQCIGTRSYTYIATLEKCRQACAKYGIGLVVLDRPNPLGGAIEGNIPQNFSFVCPFPVPYRHGLTMGELARWLNARAPRKCALTVVPVQNYHRETFEETGLPWVRTSPNIPRPTSPFFYQATGLLGELPALSIGIGTHWPFELVGAPGINATALADTLNARRLAGWTFRAVSWVPNQGRFAKQQCQGVQIVLLDPRRVQTTRLNFEIYTALRRVAPRLVMFKSKERNQMLDKVCGTSQIRRLMMQDQSAATLWNAWNQGAASFRRQSAPYRLY